MKELDLQEKYLINFMCKRGDGLGYQEAKASTVYKHYFIIKDLQYFISQTDLNKESYKSVIKDFESDKAFMNAFIDFLDDKIKASANMAIFINTHKTVTFQGERFYLFYPSGSTTQGDKLFEQNIFSVVQEMPYTFKYEGKKRFSFRPDLTFFVNGFYLGYSELKSNWNSQTKRKAKSSKRLFISRRGLFRDCKRQ